MFNSIPALNVVLYYGLWPLTIWENVGFSISDQFWINDHLGKCWVFNLWPVLNKSENLGPFWVIFVLTRSFIRHSIVQTIFTLPSFKQMQYFQNWDMTQLLVSLISSKPSVPLRAKLKKLEPFPIVWLWTVSELEEVRAKLKELEPFLLLHMSQMVRFRTKPHQNWSHP